METEYFTENELLRMDKQVNEIRKDILTDNDKLYDSVSSDNEIILMGESTHGTLEFYERRSSITKHMIREKGYTMILLEAEWPDITRVNDYIQGRGTDNSAKEAFSNITQFPVWMWNNSVSYELIEWIKEYNLSHSDNMVYVYGIDCQRFLSCMKPIIEYMHNCKHPHHAQVSTNMAIFRQFITEGQYAGCAVLGPLKPHVANIMGKLQKQLSRFQWDYLDKIIDKPKMAKEHKINSICCEQCLEILVNGEEYVRKMLEEPEGSQASWNTRDQHMLMTIMRMRNRFAQLNNGVTPKIIVWAHNSHIGNSIATSRGGTTFANNNTWNVGQMVKEMFPKSINIGFYTYGGKVTAAKKNNNSGETMELENSHPLSYEYLFHKICEKNDTNEFWLDLRKYKTDIKPNDSIDYKLNTEYRDVYTGERFIAKSIVTDEKKLTYLIDKADKKWLFVNPYGVTRIRCKPLNAYDFKDTVELFNSNLLQRWVGVHYVKKTEMDSHYGESRLAEQYDHIVFIDNTNQVC